MKMNKIFPDSEEKLLNTVVLYAHTDDVLYADEAHKTAVKKEDLLNLCMKGFAKISYKGVFYNPVAFKDLTTKIEVTIADVTSALTAKKLYSAEHVSIAV